MSDFAFQGSLKLLPIAVGNINQIRKQLEDLGTIQTKAVSQGVSKVGGGISPSVKKNLSSTAKEFDIFGQLVTRKSKDIVRGFEGIGPVAKTATDSIKKLSNQPAITNRQISDIKKAGQAIKKTGKHTKDASQNMRQLGIESASTFRKFGLFTVAIGIFRSLTSSIKRAVEASFELERTFIKIGQISNKSFKQTKRLRNEILSLSAAYGASAVDIANVALTLTQAGLASNEVSTALKSIVATDLSPTFTSITDTGEAAIAIMNQFGTSVEDLEGQFDAINSVSANFAVESDNIVSAVRRAGSVFESAGGTLNELIALYTAIRSSSREAPESIATGLKTITARIQKSGNVKKIKEALGIDLRDSLGNFIGPLKAFELISKALKGIDTNSETFFKVAEALGGFRQIARVTPLIKNFDVVQKALNVTMGASGSVYRDVEQAQESLVVQFSKLRGELNKLITQITEDDALRNLASIFINVATAITQAAHAIKPFAAILSGLAVAKGFKLLGPYFGGLKSKFTGRNSGGYIPGRGPDKDTVPAMLTKGEFVMRRSAVDRIGVNRLNAMNRGYNSGGVVQGFNKGGLSLPSKTLTGVAIGSAILSFNLLGEESDKSTGALKTFTLALKTFTLALSTAAIQILAASSTLSLVKSQFAKVGKGQFSSSTIDNLRGRVKARVSNRRLTPPSNVDAFLDPGLLVKHKASLTKVPARGAVSAVGKSGGLLSKISKLGGGIAKLAKFGSLGGIAASLVDTVAQSTLSDKTRNKTAFATKAISGAGTGALLGSAFGPLGTAIGGLGGAVLGAVSEFDAVASTVSFLTGGMIKFESQLERTTNIALKKNADEFEKLSKTLKDKVNVKNLGGVLDSNKSLRRISEDGGSRPSEEAKTKLENRAKIVRESFGELISKKDPSKVLKSFDNSQINEIVRAYQKSGEVLYFVLKKVQEEFDALQEAGKKLNAANLVHIRIMQQRLVVEKATQSALAASDPHSRASQSIQGNFASEDVTSLFSRGKSGNLDNPGSQQLDRLIQAFSTMGQTSSNPTPSSLSGNGAIARRAGSQASIISVLPKAIEEAIKITGGDGTAGEIPSQVQKILKQRGVGISGSEFKRLNDIVDEVGQVGDDLKKFNDADINTIIAKFKSGSQDLDTISNFYKAIQENNKRLQSALDVRVALEGETNSSLKSLRSIQFERVDDRSKFGKKIDPVALAGAKKNLLLKDVLRNQPGLQGRSSQELGDDIIRARARQQAIVKDKSTSKAAIFGGKNLAFDALNTKIRAATDALKLMRDSADKAAAIRTKLNELEQRESATKNIAEKFATGTNSERLQIIKDAENARRLQQGTKLGDLQQQDRAGALSTLESLRGESAKTKILERDIPGFANIGKTQEKASLVKQLDVEQSKRQDAAASLLKVNEKDVQSQDANIQLIMSSFEQTLSTILKENTSTPKKVSHTGKFEHLVKVEIKGDEIFKKMESGIKSLVASTVNQAILDMEKKNPGIEVPTMIGLGV